MINGYPFTGENPEWAMAQRIEGGGTGYGETASPDPVTFWIDDYAKANGISGGGFSYDDIHADIAFRVEQGQMDKETAHNVALGVDRLFGKTAEKDIQD